MAKKKKPALRYRDKKTGKFVSKAKWQRSRARGLSIIRRERVVRPNAKLGTKPRKITRPRTLPKPGGIFEWIVSFAYEASSRILDVITTAEDADKAIDKAIDFLQRQPGGERIINNLNDFDITAAKGKRVPRHRKTKFRRDSHA